MDDHLLFDVDDGVGVLTLNRPEKRNALTWELATELLERIRDLRGRDEIRAVVLTGSRGTFCAGADAEWISGASDRPLPGVTDLPIPRLQRKFPAGPFHQLPRAMLGLDKPVIAAVSGVAVGAGLALALACDRRVGDPTAQLGTAFVHIGATPDTGLSYFLPRVVGVSTALMMVSTGRMLGADEALSAGLLDEVATGRTALESATAYARRLASGPSVAIDLARRLIYKSLSATLDEMLDYEEILGTVASATEDYREGTRSFIEKRSPVFKGR